MKFTAIVAQEATWIAPNPAVGNKVVIEVDEDTLLEDAIERAVMEAGMPPDLPRDFWRYYWLHFLVDASQREPKHVSAPRTLVAADGQALWIEGAKDRVVIGDLLRTSEAGLMQGDPLGVFLEIPAGGDGLIPTWADFIADLVASGVVTGVVAIIQGAYKRWQERGARSPYSFLDLVYARSEWKPDELARLLRLSRDEVTDLLETFGFEPIPTDPEVWRLSKDKKRSKLRRKLRHEDD